MTGNRDYLLRVVAADLSSYEAFLKNKLTRLDGIASIESSFALSQVKYSIALPVRALFVKARSEATKQSGAARHNCRIASLSHAMTAQEETVHRSKEWATATPPA